MGNLFAIFDLLLVQPTINILLFFYHLFITAHIPFAFGFAIIALTAFVRLLLHPFFHKQMQMTAKMAEVKPHMDRLSKQHGNDKKKLSEEQMKLYKEMGVNPASGCLLALVQMPIFIALYQVLSKFTTNGKGVSHITEEINKFAYAPFLKVQSIDPNFFGMNLWAIPSEFQKYGLWYLSIPVVTAILQYFQIALSTPKQPDKAIELKRILRRMIMMKKKGIWKICKKLWEHK
ncbi:MAG TPA: YidC/Oxa1 family membrane protein insertase [Candidatus Nitrosocosmicus sp.]|nr:YidC/Oxa1 family membrane protein insertase [Candidatus Nitrosocosmicus sp.]